MATIPIPSPGVETVLTNDSEAVLDAALSAGGKVTFAFDGTITVTSLKNISTNTVLDATGHGMTISGGNSVSIFTVANGVSLTLSNLTLADGKTSTNGGAIYNQGNLSAFNCVFTSNSALGPDGTNGVNGANATGAGQAGSGTAGIAGGDVLGGAIYNSGTLALMGCVFQNNSTIAGSGGFGGNGGSAPWYAGNGGAGGAGGVARGGAIYSIGSLSITNCTFATNSATAGNSGNGGSGGTAHYYGINGRAGVAGEGSGAGIYASANGNVFSSSFYGNTAEGGNAGTNGTLTVGLNNDAGQNGGGSYGGGFCNVGTSLVVNSTFYANTVAAGNGGTGSGAGSAIGGAGGYGGNGLGGGLCSSATVGVTNCTCSSGGAKGGNGGAGGPSPRGNGPAGGNGTASGANVANGGGAFVLQSCILANSLNLTSVNTNTTIITNIITTPISTNVIPPGGCSPPNCTQSNRYAPPYCITNTATCTNIAIIFYTNYLFTTTNTITTTNVSATANAYGTFTDAGYNLSRDSTPAFSGTSHNGTDPKLDSLATNGGPTWTMLLQAGSPAINAGGDAGLAVDQRGLPRPSGGQGDVGAVEMQAPTITSNPAPQAVTVGDSVTFTVVATGGGLSYQWRFEGQNLSGATNNQFAIASVQATNAGNYDVVVADFAGFTTSQIATLTVGLPQPPTIISNPESRTVAVGQPATFTVAAAGGGLNYQWRFAGENLNGATNNPFTIANAQITNSGNYDVVVSNYSGSVTSEMATLTVAVLPSIQTQPQGKTISPGELVTFIVTADGTRPLAYQWRFNAAPIIGETRLRHTILSAQQADEGNYDVIVTNVAGAITSAPAVLRVSVPVKLANPTLVQTNLQFTFNSQIGRNYIVEFKNALNDTGWVRLSTNVGTGVSLTLTNPIAAGANASRFFRLEIE